MKIEIYQINHLRDEHRVKFLSLESMEKWQGSSKIDSHIYDKVFEGEVDCNDLEDVYRMFNIDHPDDYKGRSLSVSDIVKVCYNQPGLEYGFYYCDSIGFKKVDFEPSKAFSQLPSERSSLNKIIAEANSVKENQSPRCADDDKNLNKQIEL